ncbi:MAG TPA: hypothetical protein DD671_15225 [Balneolaceae bacterium]|nr:hypothetical protein [Balneolaceae bacterium]
MSENFLIHSEGLKSLAGLLDDTIRLHPESFKDLQSAVDHSKIDTTVLFYLTLEEQHIGCPYKMMHIGIAVWVIATCQTKKTPPLSIYG